MKVSFIYHYQFNCYTKCSSHYFPLDVVNTRMFKRKDGNRSTAVNEIPARLVKKNQGFKILKKGFTFI